MASGGVASPLLGEKRTKIATRAAPWNPGVYVKEGRAIYRYILDSYYSKKGINRRLLGDGVIHYAQSIRPDEIVIQEAVAQTKSRVTVMQNTAGRHFDTDNHVGEYVHESKYVKIDDNGRRFVVYVLHRA